MVAKICSNCKYWRHFVSVELGRHNMCTNSKSQFVLTVTKGIDTCSEFAEAGKKATLWVRIAIKIMKWRKRGTSG